MQRFEIKVAKGKGSKIRADIFVQGKDQRIIGRVFDNESKEVNGNLMGKLKGSKLFLEITRKGKRLETINFLGMDRRILNKVQEGEIESVTFKDNTGFYRLKIKASPNDSKKDLEAFLNWREERLAYYKAEADEQNYKRVDIPMN